MESDTDGTLWVFVGEKVARKWGRKVGFTVLIIYLRQVYGEIPKESTVLVVWKCETVVVIVAGLWHGEIRMV